jgi:hypothetical protein
VSEGEYGEQRVRVKVKYATVDEAMEEIRKLSVEGYKIKENTRNDPKKIVSEDELEHYLAEGLGVQYFQAEKC